MSRYDEFDESDDWDDDYPEDSDEPGTVPCPSCGAEVYEDTDRCPLCGDYIIPGATSSGSIWSGKPWWYVALGILGILAVIVSMTLLI
ncbi:hypothetical protein [Planctomicrobium sp. SH527]|uniref:hypothetical protein n=1 Tax=Planctomicrobium sp. SH527 TaxID=3448123 RepID=UPI003F5CA411